MHLFTSIAHTFVITRSGYRSSSGAIAIKNKSKKLPKTIRAIMFFYGGENLLPSSEP